MSVIGVTVVIPAFNASRFIISAVESVLNQKVSFPLHLIVVDDGSTDETVEFLLPYGDRIQVIQKVNGGVSSARNAGINAASYEFVALLDADDLMKPGRLEMQLHALDSHPKNVLCCSSVDFIDKNGELIKDRNKIFLRHSRTYESILSRLFERNFITTSSVMLRRSAAKEVGGFNEGMYYSEDCELWLKLALKGDFVVLEDKLTCYRVHEGQSIHNENLMAQGRLAARASFLEKFPEQKISLGINTVRKRMADFAIDYGYRLFLSGDARGARSAYRVGLQYFPLSVRLWRFYIRSFLGPTFHVFQSNKSSGRHA